MQNLVADLLVLLELSLSRRLTRSSVRSRHVHIRSAAIVIVVGTDLPPTRGRLIITPRGGSVRLLGRQLRDALVTGAREPLRRDAQLVARFARGLLGGYADLAFDIAYEKYELPAFGGKWRQAS